MERLRSKMLKMIPTYVIENLKNEKLYKEKLKLAKEISNLVP